MAKDQRIRWALLIIAVVLFVNAQSTFPKETVKEVEGKSCNIDDDCPCWGEYTLTGTNITSFGIGTGSCRDVQKTCDMTYCADIQEVGTWAKNNPLQWVKESPLTVIVIIGLLIMVIFWPKM